MPDVTIRRTWKVGDTLTNVTSAKLSDETTTYGVKRNDTDATVVADDTAMTNPSTGVYEYTFAATAGIAYTAYVEIVYDGATYRLEHDIPTVAATATYSGGWATVDDLESRLTEYGLIWHVDVDTVNDVASAGELNSYAVPSLQYADSVVDAAVAKFIASIASRPANDWLKDRAIDIAAYRVFSLGGRSVPMSIEESYKLSLDWLELAREGDLIIPGLNYQTETLDSGRKSSNLPIMSNPS